MVTAKTDAVRVRLVFAAMVIVIAVGIHPARAQQAGGQPGQTLSGLQGVEVLATPYFWMPWTSVGVRPSNTSLPSASNTIDFGQLLTHLTWVPLMGAVEFRNGPYGDVGGFGIGAHIDWQVIGTVDYAYKSWIDLHAGFRSLNFNYGAPRAGFDVNMYGPILAATFRF